MVPILLTSFLAACVWKIAHHTLACMVRATWSARAKPPRLVVGIRPRIRRGWLHQMSTLPRGAFFARAHWTLPAGSHHFAGRPRSPDMTGLGDPARLSSHQRTPPAVSLQPTGTSPRPQLRLLGGPDSGHVTPAGGGGSLVSAPRDPPVHLARHCQPRVRIGGGCYIFYITPPPDLHTADATHSYSDASAALMWCRQELLSAASALHAIIYSTAMSHCTVEMRPRSLENLSWQRSYKFMILYTQSQF